MQGRGHAGTCEGAATPGDAWIGNGTASYRSAKMRNGKARRRCAKAKPRFAMCLNATQRLRSAESGGAAAMNAQISAAKNGKGKE